jgi:hypothetical protein
MTQSKYATNFTVLNRMTTSTYSKDIMIFGRYLPPKRQTTLHYITEDSNLHSHYFGNLTLHRTLVYPAMLTPLAGRYGFKTCSRSVLLQ